MSLYVLLVEKEVDKVIMKITKMIRILAVSSFPGL